MYEVEYKVEITESERDELAALFARSGFAARPEVAQHDRYVFAQASPFGGYDLKRYRQEGDRAFSTEKLWEMVDGQKARKETEREISLAELERAVAPYPDALTIRKARRSWVGNYDGKPMHIDMDTVQFDHSPAPRYFIEAEMLVPAKEDVAADRAAVVAFLRQALGREDIAESPGMFAMAFKKL